jgi:hypothetical protein
MSHTPETATNPLKDPKKPGSRLREPKLIIRMAAVALVLAAGFGGMKALGSLRSRRNKPRFPSALFASTR